MCGEVDIALDSNVCLWELEMIFVSIFGFASNYGIGKRANFGN